MLDDDTRAPGGFRSFFPQASGVVAASVHSQEKCTRSGKNTDQRWLQHFCVDVHRIVSFFVSVLTTAVIVGRC